MALIEEFDSDELFDDESDFLEYFDEHELEWDEIPIKCNLCFGTGLDRHVDADCINCAGDGYV